MANVIRCIRCEAEMGMSDLPPKEYSCHCRIKVQYLGPLPMPIFDMPIESAMGSENTPDLDTIDLAKMPKWVCSWCGCNTGLAREYCRRCGCDLERTPPTSLWWRADGESRETAVSLTFQAMQPMNASLALARLRRLETTGIYELGGSEELARMMRPVVYWPDRFESQSTSKRKAHIPPTPAQLNQVNNEADRVRREIERALAKENDIHLTVTDEMTLAGDIGLDALDVAELLIAVEAALGPNVPELDLPDERLETLTVGDMVRHYTA